MTAAYPADPPDLPHLPAESAARLPAAAAAKEPWRRRLLHSLLYGRSVDRTVKTRARLGLATLLFTIGYAVIAARLVTFAAVPDSRLVRRVILQDAVATARPDILDST